MKKNKRPKAMSPKRQLKSPGLPKPGRFFTFMLLALAFCFSLNLSGQEKASSASQDLEH